MTRELKFRAYDKKNKEWLFGYEMPNLGGFSMFGEVMMMGEYANELSRRFPDDMKDIELMQYTGLKDKNGREIYEGDVILTDGWKSDIQFRGNGWWLKNGTNESFIANLERMEIIGNVWENPELLKANSK